MMLIGNQPSVFRAPRAFAIRLALAAAATLLKFSVAIAGAVCPAPPHESVMHLPHFQAALSAGSEALIVALGSSSTQGVMASDIAHSYPAILQSVLAGELPSAHIAVINRGIGGQDAAEELARLDIDVIAVRPQVVIWQVGANGAIRNVNPVAFERMVLAGVKRLVSAGIDVILMDNQRSPLILASSDHTALEVTLARVARETGVDLFSRGQLMDAWKDQGAQFARFLASDGMHHNDLGYLCVARTLADQIVASLGAPVGVAAAR